jgi:hypothetical protein
MDNNDVQDLGYYVLPYIRKCRCVPIIHGLEGGVLETDSFIAGFIKYLADEEIIEIKIKT